MPGSVRWPCLFLLVSVLVLPGDVLSAVVRAGLVIVALVFVVRVTVHVHRHLGQPSPGRTTGEAARPGLGLPVLRPLVSAGAGGSPTPLASAAPGRRRGRGMNAAERVAITLYPESHRLAEPRDGRLHFVRDSFHPGRSCRRVRVPCAVVDARACCPRWGLHTGLSVGDGPWTTHVTRGSVRRADIPDHCCRCSSSGVRDLRIFVGLVSSPGCARQLRSGFSTTAIARLAKARSRAGMQQVQPSRPADDVRADGRN